MIICLCVCVFMCVNLQHVFVCVCVRACAAPDSGSSGLFHLKLFMLPG